MDELRDFTNKLRTDFGKMSLDEKSCDPDPLKQFLRWFDEAVRAKVNEPNAMVLSTCSKEGYPSSRIVLMRNFNAEGFVFYTNYLSKKGRDIEQNPHAALNYFWPEIERQVRIEGTLVKQTDAESDTYFSTRPRESRIGAWVSEQSSVIGSREELDLRYKELEKKFEGRDVPRPHYWGGYLLRPEMFEFWQGRPSRLHDRMRYSKDGSSWKVERLSP